VNYEIFFTITGPAISAIRFALRIENCIFDKNTIMRVCLLSGLLFFVAVLAGQDTIRLMHYNLLNYGNNYGDCNSSNNNIDDKNGYLKTIVDYLRPDILTVNEIDENTAKHDYLLDHVLNPEGGDQYKRANLPNLANSPIMNQVYYNSQPLTLLSVATVETNYRDIDILQFEYGLGGGVGPIQFNCAVAHLKAGNEPADAQERASETFKLMKYLDDNSLDGNFLLAGDLNLYSGSESAFQNLLLYASEELRFYDPINKVGEWHANAFFAGIHTQSTHVSGGCPAGGGMDDRFDLILASDEVMTGTQGMKCLPGTYRAVGQDGLRLDQSLVSPANASVPQDVLSALYGMSDHLPVVLDLVMGIEPGGSPESQMPVKLAFNNPAKGSVTLSFTMPSNRELTAELLDPEGRTCMARRFTAGPGSTLTLPLDRVDPGLYFIRLSSETGLPVIRKLIVTP
jgi:hypothetical protein